jgi:hypothetical protein
VSLGSTDTKHSLGAAKRAPAPAASGSGSGSQHRARRGSASDSSSDREGSGADDDDDAGTNRAVAGAGGERLAQTVLAQAAHAGSVKQWVRLHEWKHERNRRESETIAYAVDAFLAEGVVASESDGMEILLRRLAGVELADATGKWSAADALSFTSFGSSLLPRRVQRRTMRDASAFEKYVSGAAARTSGASAKSVFAGEKSKENWRSHADGGASAHGKGKQPVKSSSFVRGAAASN